MKAPHGWDEIQRFYGWDVFLREHRGLTGAAFAAAVKAEWEPRLVLVKAPPGVSFYFDSDEDGMRDANETMRGIRVHPHAADSLTAALLDIRDEGLWSFVECCSGGYAFRLQRGSLTKASMHLFAAIDWDALRNPHRAPAQKTLLGIEPGRGVIRVFERHGWMSGGGFPDPDWQHVQYGSGY